MGCTYRGMTLAEYMDAENLTDAQVAERIGRSRVTVGRYRRALEPIPGDVVKQLVEMDRRMTADELLGIATPEGQAAE